VHHVFVDSNVLGSRTLYDWLFILRSQAEMFSLTTSVDVLDETHRVWRRRLATAGGEMRQSRETRFRENFDDILEDWVGGEASNIKDPDDQHVHNAATHCRANILLTLNIGDFGDPDDLPYDLYTPDEFFCLVNSSADFMVRDATLFQNKYWQRRRDRGDTVKSLSDALKAAGCPKFAAIVAEHLRVLAGPTT
jgi:predicted nucleic acid-binding protein